MHRVRQNPAKTPLAAPSLLLAILLIGCSQNDDKTEESTNDPAALAVAGNNPAAAFLPDSHSGDDNCDAGGALSTTLYGALAGEIEWRPHEMQCQGMPRPDGAGARLRFSGQAGADKQALAIIIAIPALEEGVDAAELASNVTVIDQSRSNFFSTPDMDTCWTDIEEQWPMAGSDTRYRIDGVLYCIGPLAEVNGDRTVTIAELSFSGQLDWGAR